MDAIFGNAHDVTVLQQCARAALVFFYGLLLLRLSGRRTFAEWSALDVVVLIVIGSSLGRTIVGNGPLWGTLAACAVLCGLHILLAWGIARYAWIARIVEGVAVELGRGGGVDSKARMRHWISECDLAEALRKKGIEDASETRLIVLEAGGEITVLKTKD